MRPARNLLLAPIVLVSLLIGQSIAPGSKSPKELADELWAMATRGELLNCRGWDDSYKGLFTNPTPFPKSKEVVVVSNRWGPAFQVGSDANTADIVVGYRDMGKIDSALRYRPPEPTDAVKTAAIYHFITVPAYSITYGPDGKTVLSKKPTGLNVWHIQGSPAPPWTTVNSAIRFVIEARDKSTDPVIRKNADQTIAKLLQLQ